METTMNLNAPTDTCIHTNNGKYIDLKNPEGYDFSLNEIGHALPKTSRYGGFSHNFCSVAQHSLNVMDSVRHEGGSIEECLQALMHDAHKAYLHDLTQPLKTLLKQEDNMAYAQAEEQMQAAIAKHFGYSFPFSDLVNEQDKKILSTEVNVYVHGRDKSKELPDMKRKIVAEEWIHRAELLVIKNNGFLPPNLFNIEERNQFMELLSNYWARDTDFSQIIKSFKIDHGIYATTRHIDRALRFLDVDYESHCFYESLREKEELRELIMENFK